MHSQVARADRVELSDLLLLGRGLVGSTLITLAADRLATILVLPVLAILHGVGERADVIEGKGCGCPAAPCAGQGLPNIDLVGATPRR